MYFHVSGLPTLLALTVPNQPRQSKLDRCTASSSFSRATLGRSIAGCYQNALGASLDSSCGLDSCSQ